MRSELRVPGLLEFVLYLYENISISGGEWKGFWPLSRCLQACNYDLACEAVDWNGMCWFHYNSTSCNGLRFGNNIRHYQMKQCPGNPAYNCSCSTGGTCVRTYTSPTQISSEECVCNLGRTGDQCLGFVECTALTIPNAAPSPAPGGYRFGSTVTYTCNSRYQLSDGSGNSFTLTCGPRGTFEGERKTCTRTCDLPVGDHLRQVTQRSVTFEGQTITYTCDTGFQFNDTSTVKNLTCQADGTFDQSLPSCAPISCVFPTDKFNLDLAEGPYVYKQNVTLSCIPGYHFSGYDVDASFKSQCIATNTLEPPIPDCIKRTCTLPHLNNTVTASDSTTLFFMTSVEFKCMKGFQFPDGNTSVTLTCDETGGFGVDSLSCTAVLPEAGTQTASTDPNNGVSVGVGVTGAIVLIFLVVIVVVFVKRRRKQCHSSQPPRAVKADHSDTSELHQNSLSQPEYVSLEAKTMSTVNRVAEYVNVNDSDYTALSTVAIKDSHRHPTPANAVNCDNSELYQNSLSPPDSADRDHEYLSLEANTMSKGNRVAGYANASDSTYTVLGMPTNESNQQQPTAAGIYQNEV
ncbi:sushi, von Willebrand factor type A, EGF and pentraxin domain-containing protein 1 [Lingula anatina]|uniref:Sushi, von Willebrand factor type A, EGF and pentraxin domain-containing protein 1 n=1 Tax=Lingula anatina TaxID=7574 RepID=A0A1S3IMY8_LINAN|nr:sushi, von Willebrand factor type A, EGF and pentraxin domain-containing protein 1 [Lingula anatina]|eukprot:XP_013399600.1 sushi, von Willebrand factor type A, EGF and pentraxin domain-containing protein 1 [Lingula anatina]